MLEWHFFGDILNSKRNANVCSDPVPWRSCPGNVHLSSATLWHDCLHCWCKTDSSVNTTVRHCLQFQLVWFLAHCRHARLCLRVITGTRAGRQFRRSRARRLRRTVSLQIGAWWRPMVRWAVSEAVRKRSLWWLWKIWRSCLGVVTRGLPLLGRSSVTPLAVKCCCNSLSVVTSCQTPDSSFTPCCSQSWHGCCVQNVSDSKRAVASFYCKWTA